MYRHAVLSDDRREPYRLTRVWDAHEATLTWLMLNPSTADATTDDATVRRCIGFAETAGYGGIVVVNLYALRATDPKGLRFDMRDVGPSNDLSIEDATWGQAVVVAHGVLRIAVIRLVRPRAAQLFCLDVTKDGFPRHPVRLAGTTPLQPYTTPTLG